MFIYIYVLFTFSIRSKLSRQSYFSTYFFFFLKFILASFSFLHHCIVTAAARWDFQTVLNPLQENRALQGRTLDMWTCGHVDTSYLVAGALVSGRKARPQTDHEQRPGREQQLEPPRDLSSHLP